MRTPAISIVIPTYNRPALLPRSLASARTQIGVAVEVIVVDDGSEPPAAIPDGPDVTLLRIANQGASTARNIGLARATAEHVMFLDSDDWLEPDAAARLLETLRASGAAVAFGHWRNVQEGTGATHVMIPPAPYRDGLANAVAGGWIPGSFLMRRADVAAFDPALTIWEVVIFECESLVGGGTAAACDAVVVNIAQHADPARISNRYDHFEPLMTARTFAGLKDRLGARGLLTAERIAALNERLLPCLYGLVRGGRLEEAREVYGAIEWAGPFGPGSCRPVSFAWCARRGGLAGAQVFLALNRAIGR